VGVRTLRQASPLGGLMVTAAVAAGTTAAVCLVHHPLLAYVALPGFLSLILVGPVAVLAAIAAAGWAVSARRPALRLGPGAVAALAWTGIALLVPGHLALVLTQGEPLFCF
jgi:hypothetical protein